MIVSHDPESARIADRIVRIRDGRVSEEWSRADGEADTIVVGRGGWLRLPEELLLRAGIGAKATARFDDGTVVVEATGEARVAERVSDTPKVSDTTSGRLVLTATGLTHRYGATTVFEDIGLELHAGRLHAITGPSGSGKTTLLHLLAGLELPDAGTVTVDGTELTALDRAARARLRREKIAYVGQQTGPRPAPLRARERRAGARPARPRRDAAGRARGARLGRARRSGRPSGSRGSRRASGRVWRSRGRSRPGRCVLLADEPTSRLDGANAISVAILLARLARDTGAAVVCATHDPLVIEQADTAISLAHLPRSGEDR